MTKTQGDHHEETNTDMIVHTATAVMQRNPGPRCGRRTKRGSIDSMQQSSGCLFSTFLGQGAWFRHVANIEGVEFSSKQIDGHYLFVARELPRSERVDDGSYWEWTEEATVITSDMHRGYVVSDGWDETHFTRGATLTVSLNGPTLNLLTCRGAILDGVSHWISKN